MDDKAQLKLTQLEDYRFKVEFAPAGTPAHTPESARIPDLLTDEHPPVGSGRGPGPADLLGTAVANCLAASLLFAMRKFQNAPEPITAEAWVRQGRNERGRLRVQRIGVDLHLGMAAGDVRMLDRILEQFEDFCVVTQSVRGPIAVDVRVIDRTGAVLKSADGV